MEHLSAIWNLPLPDDDKVKVFGILKEMFTNGEDISMFFLAPTPELKAAVLQQELVSRKRRLDSTTFVQDVTQHATKRQKAFLEYRPAFVEPNDVLGSPDPVLVALRWLFLQVSVGPKVDILTLKEERAKNKVAVESWVSQGRPNQRPTVHEKFCYSGILAFFKAASHGQEGLVYGGEGFGNLRKADLQGFISRKDMRTPCEVKRMVRSATDKDPNGLEANALDIKQVADHLKNSSSQDHVALGCLFCRLDRFWVVKYFRSTDSTQVTPHFPRAQRPSEIPHQLDLTDPKFVLMRTRSIDESTDATNLADVLPPKPSAGFSSLVAYMEQLRTVFHLPQSTVGFVPQDGDIILPSDLKIIAYGRKSLVMLRLSRSTILKISEAAQAEIEQRVHLGTDGHPNLRRLLSQGTVDLGCEAGVFRYLELDGYGQPFSGVHVRSLDAMEDMWEQAHSGLRHFHARGYFHRDLKPDNMLVFPGDVLKINDYGVSCAKDDTRASSEVVGTLGFQSPSSMVPYTEEDDVLSLALAFYSVKTGLVPPTSKKERLRILQKELHPELFPAAMRLAVQQALSRPGLDFSDDAEEFHFDDYED